MDAVSKPVRKVLGTYRTEYAIYGTVLVSAVIAVGWEDDTDLEVLLFTLGSVGVFWLAHVYSGTVAREDTSQPRFRAILDRGAGLDAAHGRAAHRDGAAAIFLLLAVVGVVDEYVAYYAALWVGVLVLAVLGYLASARRGSPWYWRVLSALVTASLGLLVIWLSSLVH